MKNRSRNYLDQKKKPASKSPGNNDKGVNQPQPGGTDFELPVAPVEEPQKKDVPVEADKS